MSHNAGLARKHFQTSRENDYLSIKELTTQIGHRPEEWPLVVLKELVDNSLDAAEEAGIAPEIKIVVDKTGITIRDNGPGIPESVIDGVLDFSIRVSSREAYVAPDRGAQGNALKTLVAMPYALFGTGTVVVIAQGIRHEISTSMDQVHQRPKIDHAKIKVRKTKGTSICVEFASEKASFLGDGQNGHFLQVVGWDEEDEDTDDEISNSEKASFFVPAAKDHFLQLADCYAWLNPHLTVTVDWNGDTSKTKRSRPDWKKWKPSNPTDPKWYTVENLQRLIAANLNHGTKTVRELVSEFNGLTSTVKVKRVLEASGLARTQLSELVAGGKFDDAQISKLLKAMQAETKPVKPAALGVIGQDHFKQRCEKLGGDMNSFKYKKILGFDGDIPYVIETMFCYCPKLESRRFVVGVNWSPGIVNPFRQLGKFGRSLDSILSKQYSGEDEPIVFVLHVACPKVAYADRGKSTVIVRG